MDTSNSTGNADRIIINHLFGDKFVDLRGLKKPDLLRFGQIVSGQKEFSPYDLDQIGLLYFYEQILQKYKPYFKYMITTTLNTIFCATNKDYWGPDHWGKENVSPDSPDHVFSKLQFPEGINWSSRAIVVAKRSNMSGDPIDQYDRSRIILLSNGLFFHWIETGFMRYFQGEEKADVEKEGYLAQARCVLRITVKKISLEDFVELIIHDRGREDHSGFSSGSLVCLLHKEIEKMVEKKQKLFDDAYSLFESALLLDRKLGSGSIFPISITTLVK